MDVERFRRIQTLFNAALEQDPSERKAFLQQECRGDEELLSEVEQLLAADQGSTAGTRRPARSHSEEQKIGNYEILSVLGEGGMGIVYLAEQREPLRRRVALKVMKHGLDSNRVLARFGSERQALALMNHPGVAKVFDAGTTEDGRPYFVMEYVPGLPITDFCDHRQLPVPERLKLFMQICDAIHHAHQKGLIHRDIKPSNVLVSEQDGTQSVKVIDFGVAKATNQPLTERTLFTEQGMLVGTPAYMSPEQAGTTALDVDTRSDIYALGVLLYELLVGALPIDPQMLRQAAAAEMLRIIREEEPLKPTTRIEKLGQTAETVARQRQTDVRSLLRFLKGELDWITMRALEKDPSRRYASASEFGADVERYLQGEPVLAGPPGAAYRIRKLAWKHRATAVAVAAVVLSLTIGLAVSTALYFRASSERERVQVEADAWQAALREQPELYLRLAKDAIDRHRQAVGAKSLQFARYLVNHISILSLFSIRPAERQSWYQEAIEVTERALDQGDTSAVDLLLILADVAEDQKEADAGVRLSSKAFDLVQQLPNASRDDRERLSDMLERRIPAAATDAEAERTARQILELRREILPSGSRKLAQITETLAEILARKGSALRRRGEHGAAVPVFREALTLFGELSGGPAGHTKARLLELESELGVSLAETGNLDQAEQLLVRVYEELSKTEGIRSSTTQTVLARVIDLYERRGAREQTALYRMRQPVIALRDAWELGTLRFPGGRPGWRDGLSIALNQRSTWVFWSDNAAAGVGLLDNNSLQTIQPNLFEGVLCAPDCNSQDLFLPRSVVADPVRQRALLFYSRWRRTAHGGKTPVGASLAVWRNAESPAERPLVRPESNEPTLLFGPDEPAWGKAAFSVGDLLYTYACTEVEKSLDMECLLARVPLERALDRAAWRFHGTNGNWSADADDAKPVMRLDKTAVFTVHWNAYLEKFLAIGTQVLSHRIRIRMADRPQGPWLESGIEIEGLRPTDWSPFPWIGLSVGHPELARDNGRVEYITYSRSTAVGNEIRLVRVEFR